MIIQGTDEWKQLRAGKATASRIKDVVARTKSGYAASRETYLTELVIERFGVLNEGYISAAMQHGTETEPFARHEYETRNKTMVDEVDFIDHPNIKMAGASPDGLIGDTGLVEIKCPDSKTHFNYLMANEVPKQYMPQMAWQMACTGALWCDFVSYDNRVPEGLEYFEIRYSRNDEYIKTLEDEVEKFLEEVDERYKKLNEILLRKAA